MIAGTTLIQRIRTWLVSGRGQWTVRRAKRRLQVARYWRNAADLDQAAQAAHHALRLVQRCPSDAVPVMFVADIATTVAQIERDRDEYAVGRDHFEYAASLLEPVTAAADRDRLLTRTLLGLGDCHRRDGHYPDATQVLDRARQLAEAADAAEPDLLAAVLTLQGITAKEIGEFDRAACAYAQVHQIHRDHGATTGDAAALQHNLAGLDYSRGRYPQAEVHARHAVALRREASGPTSTEFAADLAVLASALAGQRKYGPARALFEQALAINRAARPPRRYDIAVLIHNLADIEHATGQTDNAEHLYLQALTLKEQVLGVDHPEVGLLANNLATLLHEQQRRPEAETFYRRALAIAERKFPPEHPTTLRVRQHLHELTHHLEPDPAGAALTT
jgi:tetratricopeptide (TPR) repeat protein